MKRKEIKFTASKSSGEVSGILCLPPDVKYLYVFAHGAGAGMNHGFMESVSELLSEQGIGTLRFNFPYVEKGKKSPDPAPILIQTIRSAVEAAKKYSGDIKLFAGGKSMGGRMTSMADAKEPLGVNGIIFFGFPLHAPGKPSNERAEHLYSVSAPLLFLQGTRDKLADLKLLNPVIKKLKDKADIHIIDGADHSFHLPKSMGRTDEEVQKELVIKVKEWMVKNS
jgi:predicted alpha/beta-hydrolase family hydrolase